MSWGPPNGKLSRPPVGRPRRQYGAGVKGGKLRGWVRPRMLNHGTTDCMTVRPRRRRARAALVCTSVICALALLDGCGKRVRAGGHSVPPEPGSPVVRGARDGLELWWWVVTDRRSVPGVLPPAGSVGPTDPATAAL